MARPRKMAASAIGQFMATSSAMRIIEGANSFHIVRVLERVEQHHTPFAEAQIEIREKLKKEAEKAAREKYQARLEGEIHVWTIFDDPEFVKSVGLPKDAFRR